MNCITTATRHLTLLTSVLATGLSMFGAAPAAGGEFEWTLQAPNPYPSLAIPHVGFFGQDRGYIVSLNSNNSLVTTDGGQTWSKANLPNNGYGEIFILDDQHGWVTGSNGTARTMDGGVTWQPLGFQNNGYDLCFYNPDFGWISDNYAAAITHDGGLTWTHALLNNAQVVYPDFADDNIGVGIEDDDTGLWRTTDGGMSWTQVLDRPFNNFDEFHTVKFLDANTVIASGYSTIFRSTDAGQTWSEVYTDPGLYTAGRFTQIDGQTLFIDHFTDGFLTTDAGQTWTKIDLPYYIGHVELRSGTELYAGNADGQIVRSPDAGLTWELLYDGPDFGVTGFVFRTANEFLAVGANMIIKSFDAGATWALTSSGSRYAVTDIAISDNDNGLGFTTGDTSVVCRTEDNGDQWVLQRDLNFVDAWCVEMVTDDVIFVGGQQGFPKRSLDGGQTWDVPATGMSAIAAITDFSFLNEQVGWASAGYSGTAHVVKTTDGGETWTIKEGPVSGGFRAIHFFNETTGVVLHSEDLVIRTTDDGATWTHHLLPNASGVDMSFASENVGWCAGDFGTISKTTDGGVNWVAQNSGTFEHLLDVHAISETEAWVGGGNATLLHTTDGGATWQQVDIDALAPLNTFFHVQAIETDGHGAMWVGGSNGLVFHRPGEPAGVHGDLTGDGVVDVFDLFELLSAWGACSGSPCPADLNGDNVVDVFDLFELLGAWS